MQREPRPRRLLAMALLLIAGPVLAATLTEYTHPSEVSLGTRDPFIEMAAGADSGPNDHVSGFSISTNRTAFDATLHGLGGARVHVSELFLLKNVDDAQHPVLLSGGPIDHPYVTSFEVEIVDGATSLGTVDLTEPSPALDLGDVPGGAAYSGRVTFGLAEGAGQDNTDVAVELRLRFT